MSRKTIEQKYDEIARKPLVATPGASCTTMLESKGIPSRVYPTYDNIINFLKSARAELPRLGKEELSCVQKEMNVIVRSAVDATARKVARDGRADLVKKIEERTNKIDKKKAGTTLTMAMQRTFKELR